MLKRGARGSTVFRPRRAPADVPPFPVEVLNVLGAGDAFASGFLYGYLQGWPLERAARMGNACGAIVVTRHGCANFMPTLDEVAAFVARARRASDMTARQSTIRLTMAQAVVRFLAQQRTARDGREQPLFGGVFGIFGHGNVAGIGQALHEQRGALPLLPGAQRAGDGAHRRRLREDAQPAADAGLHHARSARARPT